MIERKILRTFFFKNNTQYMEKEMKLNFLCKSMLKTVVLDDRKKQVKFINERLPRCMYCTGSSKMCFVFNI
jgi:hypothetical protein